MIDDGIDEAIVERHMARRRSEDATYVDAYKRRFYVIDHLLDSFMDDKKKVRWAILELLGAGIDTTASLMVHAIYHLSRQPQLWKELEEEIGRLDGKMPDEEALRSMDLLDALIKESTFVCPYIDSTDILRLRTQMKC